MSAAVAVRRKTQVASVEAANLAFTAWLATALTRLAKLEALATEAQHVDGSGIFEGDLHACRIDGIAVQELRLAAEQLQKMASAGATDKALILLEEVLENVNALIRGAELAGPFKHPERSALHLQMLTELNAYVEGGIEPFEHLFTTQPTPEPAPARPSMLSTEGSPDDESDRRELSRQSVHQIAALVSGLRIFEEEQSTETSAFVYGVCARISQLTEIIHVAMRLHGLADDDAGPSDVNHLRAVFEGRLV